jgi:hypothetical protein
MAKIVTRETNVVEATPGQNTTAQVISSQEKAETPDTLAYILYFVLGVIEVLLAFRFILKITGANPVSGFVRFVYSVSNILVWPFEGIFHRAVNQGLETSSVFEPSILVAAIVYAVVAWGILNLIALMAGKPPQE